ncbi:MAG: phosphatase PAP2 family protein [Pseudomonadota bacterium]
MNLSAKNRISVTSMTIDASNSQTFWRHHGWWPLVFFLAIYGALGFGGFDRPLADRFFFDAMTQHWLGTGDGEWWARTLIHTAGGWFVRGVAVSALVIWAVSFRLFALREWRRPAGYVFVAMLLGTALVGTLKAFTNVDCPWDLAGYGGSDPYVALFADRPDGLPRAKCFPGAHSSSGFALMALYFALRDRAHGLALWALGFALVIGAVFSFGQEARGAHFPSHDLASAGLVWYVELGLYAWMLRPPARVPQD